MVSLLFTILGVISLISLLLVFLVYWNVPELNNLHGKIVLNNVMSIVFVTIFILIVYNIVMYDNLFCKIIGYFGYFSTMSMFSWMTIMCIDLSCVLKSEELQHHLSGKLRLRIYSVVGWGAGLLLALVLFILEQSVPEGSNLNPKIGKQTCFISGENDKLLYLFHLPILIMMLTNIFFYTLILVNLCRAQKATRRARLSRRYYSCS